MRSFYIYLYENGVKYCRGGRGDGIDSSIHTLHYSFSTDDI